MKGSEITKWKKYDRIEFKIDKYCLFKGDWVVYMSPGLMRMLFTFLAMGFMFLSVILILFARERLKGVLRVVTSVVAYSLMIFSGFLVIVFVIIGPSL